MIEGNRSATNQAVAAAKGRVATVPPAQAADIAEVLPVLNELRDLPSGYASRDAAVPVAYRFGLFQGDGIQGFIDQRSRTPEQLTKSLALSLLAVGNWKLCEFTNAMLVLVPEHYAIYRDAGWDRDRATRRTG